jgi:hypothetical protein
MSEALASSLEVPLESLVALAVEHWRLSTWIADREGSDIAPARHAVRRLGDFLAQVQMEARSLDGEPADAGLAAHVVDSVDDPEMATGKVVIEETLSPLVLWRGKVIREAQVVIRRGVGT